MLPKASNLTTAASAILLGITLALCVSAYWVNPYGHHVSIGPNFHIGVYDGSGDYDIGRIAVFTHPHGPYTGGMIGVVGGRSPSLVGFGDTAGVYFRYFNHSNPKNWTLMVSLWYPLIFFSVLPGIWLWRYRFKARGQELCSACGYDCRASVKTCPECGEAIASGGRG